MAPCSPGLSARPTSCFFRPRVGLPLDCLAHPSGAFHWLKMSRGDRGLCLLHDSGFSLSSTIFVLECYIVMAICKRSTGMIWRCKLNFVEITYRSPPHVFCTQQSLSKAKVMLGQTGIILKESWDLELSAEIPEQVLKLRIANREQRFGNPGNQVTAVRGGGPA